MLKCVIGSSRQSGSILYALLDHKEFMAEWKSSVSFFVFRLKSMIKISFELVDQRKLFIPKKKLKAKKA